MFRGRTLCAIWIPIALSAALPGVAAAQDERRVEVAGGYSFMRDYDGDASFPRGWFASVGADVVGPVDAVGEASGSYKSMGGLDVNISVNVHTFLGGPRVQWQTGRVAPYGQMLFGVARMATTFDVPGETLSAARNYFTMAPGGGLDIQFSERGALRLGASLRLIRTETFTPAGSEPYTFKEFQFIAGVAFR
jgi:hypothetical protein